MEQIWPHTDVAGKRSMIDVSDNHGYSSFLNFFKSKLSAQRGSRTHHSEIKSHTFYRQSQPATPEYLSLILHKDTINGNLFKVSCNIEPENTSVSFYSVTLKIIVSQFKRVLLVHDFIISLIIWKIWILWVIQILQILTRFVMQHQWIEFINITTTLIRKILQYWEIFAPG